MTKTKKATEESTSFSSSEHQFQPREDDEEVLWDVIDIIDEKRAQYLVNWAGVDPATKKPWKPSWVAKGDVTDDLVEKWKKHKKERQGSAAARRKKCALQYFDDYSAPMIPQY
ncbi:hypothetical protein F5887DRAFT_892276 [Amanita rubescens]|nr:hypothetical protein F5887DRAFT_892276 [Amanita rubescens]